MGRFHYKDGWYFERLEDGSVKITYPGGWIDDKKRAEEEFVIDSSSWASIVASVTPAGDNAETFRAAEKLHSGE